MINPNLTWKDIKLNLLGSITSYLRPRTKRREWLTSSTIQIIKNLTTNIHHQFARHHRMYITHRIRADKRLFIANLSNSIHINFDNDNIYKAFQSLKLLTTFKTNPLPRLPLNNNKIITDPKEQLDLWIDHYMNLYRTRWPRPRCDYPFQSPSQNLNKSDIVGAIKRLKMHKAAGADGIFAELWKIEVDLSASLLLPLFREIWNTGKFPDEWMTSIILNFPKNKSPNCLKDYRGLNQSLTGYFLTLSHHTGMAYYELTMALKVILEKARMHKSPIFALMIDLSQAFDSIIQHKIWPLLENIGIDKYLIALIKIIYDNHSVVPQHLNMKSQPFRANRGLKQGCIFSPIIFNVIMNDILNKSLKQKYALNTYYSDQQHFNDMHNSLNFLCYADDVCILANSEYKLRNILSLFVNNCDGYGLRVNYTKTKFITSNTDASNLNPFNFEGNTIELVSDFKYLGTRITSGLTFLDTKSRTNNARLRYHQLSKLWSSNQISTNLKIRLFKRITKTYYPYNISSTTLWNRCDILPINRLIPLRRLELLGHSLRHSQENMIFSSLKWCPDGRNNTPKYYWLAKCLKDMDLINLSFADFMALSKNKKHLKEHLQCIDDNDNNYETISCIMDNEKVHWLNNNAITRTNPNIIGTAHTRSTGHTIFGIPNNKQDASLDCEIRWNSTYQERGLLLKPAIKKLVNEVITNIILQEKQLSEEEWDDIVKIKSILLPLYETTNMDESQQNRLDIVFKQNYVQLCEINFYLSEPRSKSDTDPLMWWKTNAHRIPILSKMARDYLSIQGTSTA
ncbi:uncharacterized protein LOC135923994 [Gordionus sp. m RMFG-2023]|uniref:uncharacterized protein LOC135923994 n=1 Tax=Gordionus sp. m RMFG-2023 TaxID=3053472 RepID=UPI0031FBD976